MVFRSRVTKDIENSNIRGRLDGHSTLLMEKAKKIAELRSEVSSLTKTVELLVSQNTKFARLLKLLKYSEESSTYGRVLATYALMAGEETPPTPLASISLTNGVTRTLYKEDAKDTVKETKARGRK